MGYKKNIASNFLTQISISVLAFLVSIIVSRVLGTEGKGISVSFLLFFQTLGQYGHFGITYATPYFSKKTEYTSLEVFNSNFAYTMVICLTMSITVIFGKGFGFIFSEYSYFMVILGVCILTFTMIAEFLSTFYISDERIVEVNRINLNSNILKLGTIIVLWFTNTLNLYTYLLVISFPVIFNSIFLIKNLKVNFRFVLDKILIKKEFKFGLTIYLATLFIFMNYKIDQFFIDFMLGKSQLGIYATAVSLAELLFMIPGSVSSAILGRLYNMSNSSEEERKRLTSNTIKVTFYITLVLMIIGILCTALIPIVYGEAFREAITPTIILFIGILFASIGRVSASYFQSSGNPKVHLYITFVVFAVNVVLNACLIPFIGINGAAIASSISYAVYGIVYVIIFIKKENFTFEGLFLFSKEEINSIKGLKNKILKK
ncbi:flippase [Clostridium sp.]|uniref:flippase n=1 Tax=Clostridium sp. TaxID=1506 RepID=UPI00321727F9